MMTPTTQTATTAIPTTIPQSILASRYRPRLARMVCTRPIMKTAHRPQKNRMASCNQTLSPMNAARSASISASAHNLRPPHHFRKGA